jgi:molybdopterin/thiamine biosynthesis adenylyltransferase
MQAAEVLKLITGVGRPLTGRLLMIDGRAMEFTEMRTSRQAGCTVCGQH